MAQFLFPTKSHEARVLNEPKSMFQIQRSKVSLQQVLTQNEKPSVKKKRKSSDEKELF